ncbi:MAG: hypothetical protein EHM41_00275 [Chloroflexi bacterium]|nr:MAG: hypothetical protein EHM41_00275 [Chloroflexota bacterium]
MQTNTCKCGQTAIGPEFLKPYHGQDLCRDCYAIEARVTEFNPDIVLENIIKHLEEHGAYPMDYPGISEPGCTDRPGIAANWNKVSDKLQSFVENKLDIEVLWSDEWTACDDCGCAVRTSPDSYSWLPSYVRINDGCAIICRDCYTNSLPEIIDEFKNDNRKALPDDFQAILEINGWTRGTERYESGFYPGQDNKPEKIAEAIQDRNPELDFIFVLTGKGQFDIHFIVYTKTRED